MKNAAIIFTLFALFSLVACQKTEPPSPIKGRSIGNDGITGWVGDTIKPETATAECKFAGTVLMEDYYVCDVMIKLDIGIIIKPLKSTNPNFQYKHLQRVRVDYELVPTEPNCPLAEPAVIYCVEELKPDKLKLQPTKIKKLAATL